MGETTEGDDVRFTRKGSDLYATILGTPKTRTATIEGIAVRPGIQVALLGDVTPLYTKTADGDLQVLLPEHLAGNYAYVLKLTRYAR